MAQPPPLDPYWNLSEVSLLRRILTNLNDWIANGAGGGVKSIIAGANVTISPISGLGDVTINATGGGGGGGGNDFDSGTNNAGNTTISPTQPTFTYQLTFGGSARSSIIILNAAGRTAGDKLFLDLAFPATANIVISVRNDTSGGTLLLPVETFPTQNITTDGSIRSSHMEFTFDGAAWIYDMANLPA